MKPNERLRLFRRDIALLLDIEEFDVVYTTHLADLAGRPLSSIWRRVNKLARYKCIAPVTNPLNYAPGPGLDPRLLLLGKAGAEALADHPFDLPHVPFRDPRARIKNLQTKPTADETRRRRVYNLRHNILRPALVAAFCRATRGTGIDVIRRRALFPDGLPFPLTVPVVHNHEADVVGVSPDSVGGLRYTHLDAANNAVYFFDEIDNGTESVYVDDLTQSSIYRKLLGYAGIQRERIHTTLLGWPSFRVRWLWPDMARLEEVMRMIDRTGLRNLPGFRPNQHLNSLHRVVDPDQDILTTWGTFNGEAVSLKR